LFVFHESVYVNGMRERVDVLFRFAGDKNNHHEQHSQNARGAGCGAP
jgi:hypothetical protein